MTPSTGTLAATQLALKPHAPIDFGAAAVERLPDLVAGDPARVFLVTDRGLRASGIVDRVLRILDAADVETVVYDGVEPNPTTDNIDQAAGQARDFGHGTVVALGGGSVIDVAKGIALVAVNDGAAAEFDFRHPPANPPLPIVAVPTTAGSGAETNGFAVIEDQAAHRKIYVGHRSVQPGRVILDPALTIGLPAGATAATGMDALVHGIESLASRRSNPMSAAYASQAITLVSSSLRAAVADGTDLEARSRLLFGAHLAGLALSISGLGLVHGIAHSLTNHTGAVHGLALSAVLDEVMTRTADVAQSAYASVATAMGVARAAEPAGAEAAGRAGIAAVRDLADDVGARLSLRALGADEAMLPSIAAGALADLVGTNHPRTFSQDEVEEVLAATL